MDFNELVADFAKRHAVKGLAAQDGTAALDIDGITVTLVETWRRLLADFRPAAALAAAENAEAPSFGEGGFLQV